MPRSTARAIVADLQASLKATASPSVAEDEDAIRRVNTQIVRNIIDKLNQSLHIIFQHKTKTRDRITTLNSTVQMTNTAPTPDYQSLVE